MTIACFALLLTVAPHMAAHSEERGQATRPDQTSQTQQAQMIRDVVQKRGVGEHAPRVTVTLLDRSEVKGFIRQVDVTSFQVTDPRSGRTLTIAYDTVERVRGGTSRGAKAAIWAGVAAGIAGVVILLIGASWHGN